jgi:hypothetical protein
MATTNPDDEEAIRELQEYIEKYRERLTKAGLDDATRQMIQETTAFAEANRAGKTGSSATVAWDKLLASLREASAEQVPKSNLEP